MDNSRTAADLPNGIPASLSRLKELASNLWWSWTPEARRLFEYIDPTLWVLTHHNPVKLLADVRGLDSSTSPKTPRTCGCTLLPSRPTTSIVRMDTVGLKHSTAI